MKRRGSASGEPNRMRVITSYSIHYTKLYDFWVMEFHGSGSDQQLLDELARLEPRELLHAGNAVAQGLRLDQFSGSRLCEQTLESFDLVEAEKLLRSRITSYNVCYTKLLRPFKLQRFLDPANSLPRSMLVLHQSKPHILIASLPEADTGRHGYFRFTEQELREFEGPHMSIWQRDRITSYNVCYTKLLRFWTGLLAFLVEPKATTVACGSGVSLIIRKNSMSFGLAPGHPPSMKWTPSPSNC